MNTMKSKIVRHLILSVLLTASFVRADDDTLKIDYNRFDDETSVSTESYSIAEFHELSAAFLFHGQKMRARPRTISLLLTFHHVRPAEKPMCEKGCNVRMIIDGKRLPGSLPTTNPQLGGGGVLDWTSIEIPLATFRRIAAGKLVEIAIGGNEAPKLSDTELSAFRDMVRYIDTAKSSAK